MAVDGLRREVHNWRREHRKSVTYIKINPENFHELASDKESRQFLELYEDDNRIIGHKFIGIPLIITEEVDTIEIA